MTLPFLNCNKGKNKEILYMVFSYRLMQWKKHSLIIINRDFPCFPLSSTSFVSLCFHVFCSFGGHMTCHKAITLVHYLGILGKYYVPMYLLYVKVNIDFHEKMSTKSSIFRIKMYWSGQVCWTWQVCTIVRKKEKRVATLKSNDSFFVS